VDTKQVKSAEKNGKTLSQSNEYKRKSPEESKAGRSEKEISI